MFTFNMTVIGCFVIAALICFVINEIEVAEIKKAVKNGREFGFKDDEWSFFN